MPPSAPAKKPTPKEPEPKQEPEEEPEPKSEVVQLNGAQISAAKDIVLSVAAGDLPRETGLAMLKRFFRIDDEAAEEIMGPAGTNTPTTPNPKPAADSA